MTNERRGFVVGRNDGIGDETADTGGGGGGQLMAAKQKAKTA